MATTQSLWPSIGIPPAPVLNNVGKAVQQLAFAAERSAMRLTYGTDRLVALLRNVLPSPDAKMLVVQCIWGFECDAISEPLLNDQDLPAGSIATHYRGNQVSADSVLVAAMAAQGITYSRTLTGYAYSVFQIPIKSFEGQLNFSVTVRGRRLYDPRKDSTAGGSGAHRLLTPSTWEYSDCPVLALADWTASTLYGAGQAVDWSSVPAVANANDQTVGGTEKRRLLGLTLSSATDVKSLAEAMRAYAGCFALPGANGIRFVADADSAPVADLVHADGQITAMSGLQLADTSQSPTAVEVIYTDTSKVPYRDGSAIVTLPGAGTTKPWRLSQVRLPGVQRYSQAMREATERLNKLTRNGMTCTVEVEEEGLRFEKADIIRVSHPLGLALTPMRVLDPVMTQAGRWRLTLQKHDASSYSDAVVTTPPVPDTDLNNPAGPPDPVANLQAERVLGALRLTRTPSTEVDWLTTRYEFSTDGGTVFTPIDLNVDRAGALWSDPQIGALIIRARDIDTNGQGGVFGPTSSVSVTVAPDDIGGPSSTLGIRINQSSFAGSPGSNYNECYIHGRDSSGNAADVDGTILLNGAPTAIAKGILWTQIGPANGFILWDSSGTGFVMDPGVGGNRPYVMARKSGGQWQYDKNIFGGPAWTNFTPTAAMYVIGLIQSGSNDTNSAPGIVSATMLAEAWTPDVIAALGTTADWTSVANRPSTYRVGATGFSAAGYPIGANLYDADSGTILIGYYPMYRVAKIHRLTKVVTDLGGFDTFNNGLTAANAMAAALNSIDSSHIGIVFTNDEPRNNRMLGNLPAAMMRMGASRAVFGSMNFKDRSAYILIGIGGCGEGAGAEYYAGAVDNDAAAWCDATLQITASGAMVVSGNTGGPKTLLDFGYVGTAELSPGAATNLATAKRATASINRVTGGAETATVAVSAVTLTLTNTLSPARTVTVEVSASAALTLQVASAGGGFVRPDGLNSKLTISQYDGGGAFVASHGDDYSDPTGKLDAGDQVTAYKAALKRVDLPPGHRLDASFWGEMRLNPSNDGTLLMRDAVLNFTEVRA
ncbi:MAG: hypothetical protein EOP37_03195 [Rubrivivax sp.]|nr:MAG: hypothetical protein EOP37_03195 [Rubrivivax sp.]